MFGKVKQANEKTLKGTNHSVLLLHLFKASVDLNTHTHTLPLIIPNYRGKWTLREVKS